MNMPKIKWKVDPASTGKYRSFDKRGWPTAFYQNEDENVCAFISCTDEYYPPNVKTGKHDPLYVRVFDYENKKYRKYTRPFSSINEVKEWVLELLKRNPNFYPKEKEKFKEGDFVKHTNGVIYQIVSIPDTTRKLEYRNEPFYEYTNIGKEKTSWVRRQSEFEDGRFVRASEDEIKRALMK